VDVDQLYDEAPVWLSPERLTFGAASVLALLTAWTTGLIGSRYGPTAIAPWPLPWVLLAAAIGWACPLLLGVMFWLWCGRLSYGKATGRTRTRAAAVSIAILSFMWFYSGWKYGLKYQSFRFNLLTAIGNCVLTVAIAVILVSPKRSNSFAWSLTANFLIFAWLVTYAFPYFGELP
jgi:hypothetical protein